MHVLQRIKRLIVRGRIRFTAKAEEELSDGLSSEEVLESVLNARSITKAVRSRSAGRELRREKLYIIVSASFGGTSIYTKGVIRRTQGEEVIYVFISAKIAD